MSTIQNLRKSLVREWKLVCSLVEDAISGAEFAPFPSPLPPGSGGRWASLQPASSSLVLLSPLFWEGAGSASHSFKLPSLVSSLRLPSGLSGPVFTLSNAAARSSPFSPHLLGVVFGHVICGFYLFFLPVRLPSKIRQLPPDPLMRGFPGVWKLPLLRLPPRDRSPSLTLLSLFFSFTFCTTSFRRQWAAFLGV